MRPLVELRGCGVTLGGIPVLRDIDLTVDPGRTVGITGPNGSGKTTLLRLIATLLEADRGRAEILGLGADGVTREEARRSIGMMGHSPALIPQLTLRENLQHIARLSGSGSDRVANVLDVVGLTAAAERKATQASFGMLRRVEIAHLLLTRPKLLLLDEATSGLDESARDLTRALAGSVLSRDGAVVVVSHDVAQLLELTDDIRHLISGTLARP